MREDARDDRSPRRATSNLEYHVMLAMAGGPKYGYAIKTAIERESDGTLMPRAGSLYRVIARLISARLVEECEAPEPSAPHPGQARKYYRLTGPGRRALAAEARRLEEIAALAAERLRAAAGGP